MLPNFQDHPRRPHVPKLGARLLWRDLSVKPAGRQNIRRPFTILFWPVSDKTNQHPTFLASLSLFACITFLRRFFFNSPPQNCLLPVDGTVSVYPVQPFQLCDTKSDAKCRYAYFIVKSHELRAVLSGVELLTGDCHTARGQCQLMVSFLFGFLLEEREKEPNTPSLIRIGSRRAEVQ